MVCSFFVVVSLQTEFKDTDGERLAFPVTSVEVEKSSYSLEQQCQWEELTF